MKVGIIGTGSQGELYAKFLVEGKVENMELVALSSPSLEKKNKFEERYPTISFYRDYKDMLESGSVEAVIVCTPHYSHPEIGIAAINRDIHVLIEKPVGVQAREVRLLNEIAQTKPILSFGLIHNQRANPLYQRLKNIIDEGEIGEIRRTNWINTTSWRPQAYYDQGKWRATWKGEGGGVLINQAAHQIDLLQWICGMPEKIFSNIKYGYQRNITVEDEVTALLDYGNGATGVFITCTHDLIGTDRFEILGDKGKIVIDDGKRITIKKLHKSEVEINKETKIDEVAAIVQGNSVASLYEEEVLEFESIWGEEHLAVLRNFAENILYKEPLIAPGIEGINSVQLFNAIYLSSWFGEEVELPVSEEIFLEELEKRIASENMN
ncbi:Gfo/Idh/MocA family protein [Oceanobacillus sp. CAU 1775]